MSTPFPKKRLALLFGLLLLVACNRALGTPPPATQIHPASISTSTLETVPPTSDPVLAEFPAGDLLQGSSEQPAGRYQTPTWFSAPFEFQTAQSYRGSGQSFDWSQLFALGRGQNELGQATHRLVFFAFPSDVSDAEMKLVLRATKFLDSGEMQVTSLNNVTGTRWDAVARPNPEQQGEGKTATRTIAIPALYQLMRVEESVWHTATPEARLRFILPDLPGPTVLIYLEAPPDEFDAWAKEVEGLLQTITFLARAEVKAIPTAAAKSAAPPGEVWMQLSGVLAIAPQDNVYVMGEDLVIHQYDPLGNLLTQWGSPGADIGQFNNRTGSFWGIDLEVGQQGNVYVADLGNFRIQKFDARGQFLLQWGGQGEGPGQFSRAWDLAVDSQGNVYVGDISRMQKFDSEGNFLLEWGQYGTGEADFQSIIAVEVDREDNIYVADFYMKQVKKFDVNGNLLTAWNSCGTNPNDNSPLPLQPVSFAFDSQNNVYVMDTLLKRVCVYDPSGNPLGIWGSSGKEFGEFSFSQGGAPMAIDSQNNLYISDGDSEFGNNRIQKFQLSIP